MKKTYFTPVTEIANTELEIIIATSSLDFGSGEGTHVADTKADNDWDIWGMADEDVEQ